MLFQKKGKIYGGKKNAEALEAKNIKIIIKKEKTILS